MTFDFAEPLALGQPDPLFDAPVPAHAADLLVGQAPDLMAARSEAPRGKHSSGWEPTAFVAPVPEPVAFSAPVPEPVAHAAPVPEPVAYAEPEPVLAVLVGKHAAPRVDEVAPEPAYVAPVLTTYPDPFAIAPASWEPAAVAEEASAPGWAADEEMADPPAGRRIAVVPVEESALFAAEPSNYPGDPGYVGDLGVPVLDLTPMPARDEPSGLAPVDLAASYDDGLSITPADEWAAEQDATLSNLPGGLVDTRRHVPHEDAPAGRRRSGTGRRAEARGPRSHPVLFGVFGLLVGVAISASLLLLVGPLLITLA